MISSKKTNKLGLKSNLTHLISFLIIISFSLQAKKLNTDSLKANLPVNFNGQIAIKKIPNLFLKKISGTRNKLTEQK